MGILEIIAEQRLGRRTFSRHPRLRLSLERAENSMRRVGTSESEKARIASIVELCFEYHRESDPKEKANILKTLDEITANVPVDLPVRSVSEWQAETTKGSRAKKR